MALLKSAFEEDGSWDINPKFPYLYNSIEEVESESSKSKERILFSEALMLNLYKTTVKHILTKTGTKHRFYNTFSKYPQTKRICFLPIG